MSQIELTTLGKSCEFFNGKAHEKDIDVNGKYVVVNSKFISQEGRVVKRTKEQMFPLYKGDIVMVMSDVPNGKALAKCFIIDQDDTYSLNQRICCIRSKEFDTKYLYYQLNRHEHFLAFNNGENQTNLRKDDILDCPLIKPSLEEQRRMVIELDEAIQKINLAKSNCNKNIENCDELLKGYFESTFVLNSGNWIVKSFEECIKLKSGDGLTSKAMAENGVYPVYGGNGIAGYHNEYNLSGDNVIIGRVGAWCGNVRHITENIWLTDNAFKVAEYKYPFNNLFLTYLLNFKNLRSYARQAAQPVISNSSLKDVELNFPESVEEQKKIVYQLEKLSNISKQLKEKYEEKLTALEELKSGVLKRAFENELIEAE
jgi:type I restriction enzyme, S subunit